MCDVLKEIYKKIYNEDFNYGELKHRIKLQKAVYVLENMGVHVGDYSFSWDKYGPYSLRLDSDAKKCSLIKEQVVAFSQVAENAFAKMRDYINQCISYSCHEWMECIASLHYLSNVWRIEEDSVIAHLVELKPRLSDNIANAKALEITKEIKVGF